MITENTDFNKCLRDSGSNQFYLSKDNICPYSQTPTKVETCKKKKR